MQPPRDTMPPPLPTLTPSMASRSMSSNVAQRLMHMVETDTLAVHVEAWTNAAAVADSSKDDLEPKEVDEETSHRTGDVVELPAVVEQARLPTHEPYTDIHYSRQPSIFEDLIESIFDHVPYLVARGLQSLIMRPKTLVLYRLHFNLFHLFFLSVYIRKSSASCNGCMGLAALHFQNGFGLSCVPDESPLLWKTLIVFMVACISMGSTFRRSWCLNLIPRFVRMHGVSLALGVAVVDEGVDGKNGLLSGWMLAMTRSVTMVN
jgi:hypothetical protein